MRKMLESHPRAVLHSGSEDHYWMSYQTENLPGRRDAHQINWSPTDPFVLKRWISQFNLKRWEKVGLDEKKKMVWAATTPEYWYQSMPICDFQNKWDDPVLCKTFTTPPYDIIPRSLRYWFPNIKFIIMTRHPADRAYSHWSTFANYGPFCQKEARGKSKQACFHRYAELYNAEWNKCIDEHGEEECSVWPRRQWGQGDFLRSISISFHDVHAHLWLRYFPPEQFHFIHTEVVQSDLENEVGQFADWVGLDLDGFNHSDLNFRNKAKKYRAKMWPETRLLLERLYKPHIERTCLMMPQACRFVDLWFEQHNLLSSGVWNCEQKRENINTWHQDCEI